MVKLVWRFERRRLERLQKQEVGTVTNRAREWWHRKYRLEYVRWSIEESIIRERIAAAEDREIIRSLLSHLPSRNSYF